MKNISDKEKKERKIKKQIKSLKNKMKGDNLVWFNSLSSRKQHDFLFEWKKYKHHNKVKEKTILYKRGYKVVLYPPSLKHFIKKKKNSFMYRVEKRIKRNTKIDLLFNS